MKRFLYKAVELKKGYTPIVNPSNSVLEYLEFGVLLLPKKGEHFEGETIDREYALTIFTGRCNINADSPSGRISFKNLGGRADIFLENQQQTISHQTQDMKLDPKQPC